MNDAFRLHPLNRGFAWKPLTGPFRRLTAEQARAYDERGFTAVEDAFDPATIAAVTAEIDAHEARVEALLQKLEGRRAFIARAGEITFTPHLVTQSARLRAFCCADVFRDLCHDVIGPDARLYWDQAVYKKPGADDPFPWHQDNGYTYVEPQHYLTCWVALTDATEENGCPWVIPGLHRLGTLAHTLTDLGWVCTEETPADAVPIPVPAGGIAVFSSLTPHATGPNRTDAVRKSYIVQFAPDGAEVVTKEGRLRADAPDRQFEILRGGEPV